MSVAYEEIVDYLLVEFPEYSNSKEFKELFNAEDLELPYIIWGHFVRFTTDLFIVDGPSNPVIQRLFAFVNKEFEDTESDPKVTNLLAIEVFEQYAQRKDTLAFARKITNDKAHFFLEPALWCTGIDRPDGRIAPDALKRRLDIEIGTSRVGPFFQKVIKLIKKSFDV